MTGLKHSVLIACGFLAACTTAKTSSQKHAEHYVYQMRNERDVNYRTLVSDSIKRAVPMFDWFYQQGVADRMAKLPRAEAQKKSIISKATSSRISSPILRALSIMSIKSR